MSENNAQVDHGSVEALYEESGYWHVNTGDEVIHAKRMPGRYRTWKWLTSAVWLSFFLGPYLRWNGHQAILLDIPNRKFQIFDITILPQDVWMLAMVLLFFAILLAAVTSLAGRVFCGYFCFQTVWTDLFTLIEDRLEGPPAKRRKLDQAPWDFSKIRIKVIKHAVWLLIGMLNGITFTLWFADAPSMWMNYFTLQVHPLAWAIVAVFTFFTYLFAGHMREQVCFWLCPYARIQGVMYDPETILPTYDVQRGEPRGKLKKGESVEGQGDCIDCNQCVAVCPTGIDIRHGQQEGCITCALCIDACDSVMDKIGKPRGLIRYASLNEIEGAMPKKFYKRPRVLIYFSIMSLAIAGLLYGLTHLGTIDLRVLHGRQPLYVLRSDGSIQNKYELKILNKTDKVMYVVVSAEGPPGMILSDADKPLELRPGRVTSHTVFVRVPAANLSEPRMSVEFEVNQQDNHEVSAEYKSMFMGPQ